MNNTKSKGLSCRWLRCVTAAFVMATAIATAHSQSFPSRPIRIIVPYGAGGALDAVMRRIAVPISESIGQPVVIDNRPGGLTAIAMQACAGAAPDGHTVCFTLEDSIIYNPLLFRKLSYDPTSLVPVINLATARSVLAASANAPFNTFKEMVAYSKAKPSGLNFGTWGPASTPDLYRQWIDRSLGIDMTSVPYKGVAGGTMQAVLAGEIDVSIYTVGQVLPHIQAGKLKPIAILGDKRFPGLPNVPSLSEEGGEPGITSVWGVYAPPGTPQPIIDRLNAEFAKGLAHASVRELLQANTLDAIGGSAGDFAKFLNNVRGNAQRIFRTLDIKPTDQPS